MILFQIWIYSSKLMVILLKKNWGWQIWELLHHIYFHSSFRCYPLFLFENILHAFGLGGTYVKWHMLCYKPSDIIYLSGTSCRRRNSLMLEGFLCVEQGSLIMINQIKWVRIKEHIHMYKCTILTWFYIPCHITSTLFSLITNGLKKSILRM